MSEQTARLIALVLLPFAIFGLRLATRFIVEWLYWNVPDGWFRRLLARDRASRTSRPEKW